MKGAAMPVSARISKCHFPSPLSFSLGSSLIREGRRIGPLVHTDALTITKGNRAATRGASEPPGGATQSPWGGDPGDPRLGWKQWQGIFFHVLIFYIGGWQSERVGLPLHYAWGNTIQYIIKSKRKKTLMLGLISKGSLPIVYMRTGVQCRIKDLELIVCIYRRYHISCRILNICNVILSICCRSPGIRQAFLYINRISTLSSCSKLP